VDVLAEAENLALVDANPLEDPVAVEKPMIVDADFGVRFVEELAVDVDLPHRASAFSYQPSAISDQPAIEVSFLSAESSWPRADGGFSTLPSTSRTTRSVLA